jgi:hypothetical protein
VENWQCVLDIRVELMLSQLDVEQEQEKMPTKNGALLSRRRWGIGYGTVSAIWKDERIPSMTCWDLSRSECLRPHQTHSSL